MENEKELKDLFKDLYTKPEKLDGQIMEKIQEFQSQKEPTKVVSHKERWIFLIPSFAVVAGIIYSFQFIDLRQYSFWWISMIAALVPVAIDKILLQYRTSGVNRE